MVIFTSSMLPGAALGLLRKWTFPTTAFDWDVVGVLFRVKKAKRRPEPATAATSKAIKTMYSVLRCLAGCVKTLAGVFVPGLRNESLPALLPARILEGVCLSFVGGSSAVVDESIWGGENCKGAGVIPRGREDCS